MKNGKDNLDELKILDIARDIAGGAEVDWNVAESSAPNSQQSVVKHLKVISNIARAHAAEQRSYHVSPDNSGFLAQDTELDSWGPLEIIEKIGDGSFGGVFRARDPRLDREVALKLFHSHRVRHSQQSSKVIEEGRLLARVRHPNVVSVFGAEQHGGRVGLWMELVEGTTLENILLDQGPLHHEDALVIGRDVCQALAGLHQAGIIHRDIKTRNIMREKGGRVVLMDLGVSREIGSQESESQYGTPLYTAPEVWLENRTSIQTDIYSVGVLLFHLVTGEYPVSGHTPEDVRKAHAVHHVQPLRSFRPDLSDSFIRLVEKALAPDPDQRFQSAGEFELAISNLLRGEKQVAVSQGHGVSRFRPLNMILVASTVVLLAALVGIYLFGNRDSMRGVFSDDRIMLAILPFENLGDPDDAFFVDGITDEILTKLSAIPELGVITRESSFKYRGNEYSIEEIGRQLGVEYVLKGTIRWQRTDDGSSRIRVSPELVSVVDNRNVWVETYEEPLDRIFVVQAGIGEMIADAMNIKLLDSSKQALSNIATQNLEAYEYHIRAKELWANMTYVEKDYPLIERFFLKAIDLDPQFAQAYAMLSLVHCEFYVYTIDRTTQRLEMAKSAFDRALALQPDLPEAYLAMSVYYNLTQKDSKRSNEAFETACRLRPNDWTILFYKGVECKSKGSFEVAIRWLRRAQVLDPARPISLVEKVLCYTWGRKYEDSERECKYMISLWPEHDFPYQHLAFLYVIRDGNTEMAKQVLRSSFGLVEETRLLESWQWIHTLEREYEKALEITDDYSDEYLSGVFKYLTQARLYYYLELHGEMTARADSARVILEKKVHAQPDDYLWHLHLGSAYSYLNRKEDAIREMNIASDLMPVSKHALKGARLLYTWAAVDVIVGEHDAAMEHLEYLIANPTDVTKPRLKIDPIWDPLREHPRFQELVN